MNTAPRGVLARRWAGGGHAGRPLPPSPLAARTEPISPAPHPVRGDVTPVTFPLCPSRTSPPLWHTAGFKSFSQYCRERLGLSPRTVEQRVALEKRLWASPALRAARDGGLSYEKVRILSRLPEREVEAWATRARALTCVELRAALSEEEDAQLRAARKLRARLLSRIAEQLQASFRAVRAVEGCLLTTAGASCGWPGTSRTPGART